MKKGYKYPYKRTYRSGVKPRDPKHVIELKTFPEPNTGCWIFNSAPNESGYGRTDPKQSYGHSTAHRLSFHLYKGEIPKGMCVLHTCDNRWCVNPDHLFLGTNEENMADMVKKGRACRGERNVKAKLTENDVLNIRNSFASGISKKTLEVQFNIGKTQLNYILNGKAWKHLLY